MPRSRQKSSRRRCSEAGMTQPVGLQGVLMNSARVFGRAASNTSSRCSRHPSGPSRWRTKSKAAPVIWKARSIFGQLGLTMSAWSPAPAAIRAAMKMPSMVEPGTTSRSGSRSRS